MAVDTRQEPWRVERGERETLTFPVLDVDDELFPIDGWEASVTIRDRPDGALLYTFPPEQVTIDPDQNTVQVVVPAPVSTLWGFTHGWYTATLHNPETDPLDPVTYRVLHGFLIVDPG